MTEIPFLDLKQINGPYMDAITRRLTEVALSGRYIGGDENGRIEKMMTDTIVTECCVGVSNGLDGLFLILEAYKCLGRLKEGDEVIVPANTYIASVLAISRARLVPVPVDADISTLNLDISKIEDALTDRTRAIMTVHLYGRVCWSKQLKQIADRQGLIVVEDCAQSIGASFSGTMSGNLGDAAAFSFYPTKNIGAMGDAGAVTTNDRLLADTVRALANYGTDRRYHNVYRGYNCRLDPMQATVLTVKLPDLNHISDSRRNLAGIYLGSIDNPAVKLPETPADSAEHVWHQFVVLTDRRDELRRFLADNGVATDINYPTPPHRQPCYADSLSHLDMPVARIVADKCLSLPLNQAMSPNQIRNVADVVNSFK